MRFILPIAGKAYRELAPLLHVRVSGVGDTALGEKVCQATAEFIRGLGRPPRLRDLGIPKTDLPSIAQEAMESKSVRANPDPSRSATRWKSSKRHGESIPRNGGRRRERLGD